MSERTTHDLMQCLAPHFSRESVRLANLAEELPDPPDNFDIWNGFPERFRERVANQFIRGTDHEYNLIRDRVQSEYAVARARQKERASRAAFKRSHNLGAG